MKDKKKKDTIQSVKKVFNIIEVLSKNEYMGVREISAATGINVTSVFRMLTTLVELGYASQLEDSGKYFLTYKLLAVGNSIVTRNSIVKLVHPYLETICQQCKETVHLVERSGTNIRYIDKVIPTSGIFATGSYVGMELPLTCTAVGKSILSQLSDEEIKEIWDHEDLIEYTPKTIKSFEELMKDINLTRQRGYAIDNEEREPGLFCVAVCILNYNGEPNHAISVSAPVSRMQGEKLEEVCSVLLNMKKKISKIIGGF